MFIEGTSVDIANAGERLKRSLPGGLAAFERALGRGRTGKRRGYRDWSQGILPKLHDVNFIPGS